MRFCPVTIIIYSYSRPIKHLLRSKNDHSVQNTKIIIQRALLWTNKELFLYVEWRQMLQIPSIQGNNKKYLTHIVTPITLHYIK
jgi:hypothetical protein